MSEKMDELLQKRKKWRKKLEYYKKGFKDGILSQREYNEKYEEIMDKLVEIEDKIIQEKMKGGEKLESERGSEEKHGDEIRKLRQEASDLKRQILKDQSKTKNKKFIDVLALVMIVGVAMATVGAYFIWYKSFQQPQVEEKLGITNSELKITNITNDNRTFYVSIRNSTGYYLVNDDGDGKIEVNESFKRSEVRMTIQDNSGNIIADYVVNDYSEETAKFTGEEGIYNDEEAQIEVTVAEEEMKAGETYIIIVTAAGTTTTEKYTAI